jgi:hypothetical protein
LQIRDDSKINVINWINQMVMFEGDHQNAGNQLLLLITGRKPLILKNTSRALPAKPLPKRDFEILKALNTAKATKCLPKKDLRDEKGTDLFSGCRKSIYQSHQNLH